MMRLCTVEGCEEKHYCKGWCKSHYYALRAVPLCAIEGCGKRSKARGWCAAHYKRWIMHGGPLNGGTGRGEPERFYRDVVLNFRGNNCLLWPYGTNGNGYGTLWLDSRHHLVHRLVCEHVNGSAPTPEHEAAHTCGKGHKGCVSQSHLVWKTHSSNMADMLSHGTLLFGERSNWAKLSENQVREIRTMEGTMLQREIAEIFGVSTGAIHAILSGKSWKHVR